LLLAFPCEKSNYFILDKLFDTRFSQKLSKAYSKVNMSERLDEYVATDAAGYLGTFHR
jgi:hypothetical protein